MAKYCTVHHELNNESFDTLYMCTFMSEILHVSPLTCDLTALVAVHIVDFPWTTAVQHCTCGVVGTRYSVDSDLNLTQQSIINHTTAVIGEVHT